MVRRRGSPSDAAEVGGFVIACVGVISDTHGLLRDEAVRLLAGVDHIIHAGDIGRPEIVARLEAIAPVSAIRGNVDEASVGVGLSRDAASDLVRPEDPRRP